MDISKDWADMNHKERADYLRSEHAKMLDGIEKKKAQEEQKKVSNG
jgi:hypothetical protein